MPKPAVPQLKQYMGKRVSAKLNAGREVTGTLMGYDQFMNLVLEAASEGVSASERRTIGSVVSWQRAAPGLCAASFSVASGSLLRGRRRTPAPQPILLAVLRLPTRRSSAAPA